MVYDTGFFPNNDLPHKCTVLDHCRTESQEILFCSFCRKVRFVISEGEIKIVVDHEQNQYSEETKKELI